MWQFSEAIDGMAEACSALGIPVVGGNVSFYNESRGSDIDPTPVVGTLGLIDELRPGTPTPALVDGSHILLIGPSGAGTISLGGSRWAAECGGYTGGKLPQLDFDLHARLLRLVATLVNERLVDGIHDVSDGGLGVALAEMAVKSSTGCHINGMVDHEEMFGEGPSRVVVSVPPADVTAVTEKARASGIPLRHIGTAEGDRFLIEGLVDMSIAECEAAWKGALPAAFSVL